MRIWCIKIGIVLVLHFNPWAKDSAGGLQASECLYGPVAKYFDARPVLVKNTNMNRTVKKKVKFINFLMHSSILRRIWLNFMVQYLFIWLLYSFHNSFSDFQLFRPEYHWRDLSSQNAHLVHQNWFRISFTSLHVYSQRERPSRDIELDPWNHVHSGWQAFTNDLWVTSIH
jgi:hypothetical protein